MEYAWREKSDLTSVTCHINESRRRGRDRNVVRTT